VVGANRGGIPDIVTDGVNGCLYDPDDDASLTAATLRLLASPERREQLRLAARQEAERWGWAGATAQLRRFYRDVGGSPLQLAA
jgi:glycosyltransferase involved in cell wall biosynthesis